MTLKTQFQTGVIIAAVLIALGGLAGDWLAWKRNPDPDKGAFEWAIFGVEALRHLFFTLGGGTLGTEFIGQAVEG